MRSRRARVFVMLLALAAGPGALWAAGNADQARQVVVALDVGPQEQAKSPEAAAQLAAAHLVRQETALRAFLVAYPQDVRGFEAQLRLARLLQIRAEFERSEKLRAESRRILDELEKTATPEQRPELDFARVARLMRGLNPSNTAQREEVLKAARQFQAAHPTDRRIAALLAEVATLFDTEPKTKQALLEDASAVATEEDLKARIADDLKRVRLLGQEVPLRFTSVQGQEVKAEDLRGKPSFVIFFANFSPPSLMALDQLQKQLADLPKGSVRVFGVCLDARPEVVTGLIKARNITWPVAHDGKSWESPLARELGINALPTVWLLDAEGHLRALNALDGAATRARQLLRER
jgi:peroxiredoxin